MKPCRVFTENPREPSHNKMATKMDTKPEKTKPRIKLQPKGSKKKQKQAGQEPRIRLGCLDAAPHSSDVQRGLPHPAKTEPSREPMDIRCVFRELVPFLLGLWEKQKENHHFWRSAILGNSRKATPLPLNMLKPVLF